MCSKGNPTNASLIWISILQAQLALDCYCQLASDSLASRATHRRSDRSPWVDATSQLAVEILVDDDTTDM